MIVAIVPALDEAECIGGVVRSMPEDVARIVVVDDGSTDGTEAAARIDRRVEVVRHHRTRGVGAAIATGCLRARALGASMAVVFAGDGQMDPRDLPALLRPLRENEADLVKGNRLAWPDGALGFPLVRLVGVVVLGALTRLASGLDVEDAQCGYVAFGARALERIDWRALWPSFGYPNDLLVRAARAGLRVAEVPVRPVPSPHSKLGARHVPGIAWVVARGLVGRVAARRPPTC